VRFSPSPGQRPEFASRPHKSPERAAQPGFAPSRASGGQTAASFLRGARSRISADHVTASSRFACSNAVPLGEAAPNEALPSDHVPSPGLNRIARFPFHTGAFTAALILPERSIKPQINFSIRRTGAITNRKTPTPSPPALDLTGQTAKHQRRDSALAQH
jgi:hypothetical protein